MSKPASQMAISGAPPPERSENPNFFKNVTDAISCGDTGFTARSGAESVPTAVLPTLGRVCRLAAAQRQLWAACGQSKLVTEHPYNG